MLAGAGVARAWETHWYAAAGRAVAAASAATVALAWDGVPYGDCGDDEASAAEAGAGAIAAGVVADGDAIVVGHSAGTNAAMAAAAVVAIERLVLVAPGLTAAEAEAEVAAGRFGMVEVDWARVATTTARVVIVHDGDDDVVDAAQGRAIADAPEAAGTKVAFVSPARGGHYLCGPELPEAVANGLAAVWL